MRAADAAIEAKEREREQIEAETEEQVGEARSAAAPTERVSPDGPSEPAETEVAPPAPQEGAPEAPNADEQPPAEPS